jgi:hypothetical protein
VQEASPLSTFVIIVNPFFCYRSTLLERHHLISQTPKSTASRDIALRPAPPPTFYQSAIMDRNQIMSRRNVEGLIAQGHTIVVFEKQVLKLDRWMEKHPGGKLPLLHMVGVDASSEIAA